jgi:hypothetical protein
VVVAREAEHQKVLMSVVTASEYPEAMMNVELALGCGYAADFAARASVGDQPPPAGGRQLGSSRAAVVCFAEPLTERGLTEQRCEGAGTAARAGRAENHEVPSSCRAGFVDAE